jgi:hypothetical protein
MNKSFSILFFTVFFLAACGGGSTSNNGDTPTSTSIDFSLFPPAFFTSYNESANLTGSDIKGVSYTGTTTDTLQTQTTFLGDPAIPVEGVIDFNGNNGSFGTATLISHFSTDPNDRRFLGVSGDVITASATTSAIPLTANIGDSGVMGTYIDNASFTTLAVWQLEDGFNGNAKLILINVTTDAGGTIDNTFTTTYLIEPDGTRISVEYVTTNINISNVVTLSGDY